MILPIYDYTIRYEIVRVVKVSEKNDKQNPLNNN